MEQAQLRLRAQGLAGLAFLVLLGILGPRLRRLVLALFPRLLAHHAWLWAWCSGRVKRIPPPPPPPSLTSASSYSDAAHVPVDADASGAGAAATDLDTEDLDAALLARGPPQIEGLEVPWGDGVEDAESIDTTPSFTPPPHRSRRSNGHCHSDAVDDALNLMRNLYLTPVGGEREVTTVQEAITITSYRTPEGKFGAFRGDGQVSGWTCQEFLSVLRDPGARVYWDPRFEGSRRLRVLSETDTLVYSTQKGNYPLVAGRDFVLVTSTVGCDVRGMQLFGRPEAEEGWLLFSTSVKDRMGPLDKTRWLVRAKLALAGWILVPTGPSSMDVSYMVQVDVGGSIPQGGCGAWGRGGDCMVLEPACLLGGEVGIRL